MKYLEAVKSPENRPRLIPNYKQTERRLLSVFLALLSHSSNSRGLFMRQCGCNFGRTAKYSSAMEVSFQGSQMPEVRPDGLVVCQKGKTSWAALIEAKAEGKPIRADQIAGYIQLAKIIGVENIITFSNEFARVPSEPPYHVDGKRSRGINVFHFAWADIRTTLMLLKGDPELDEVERGLLDECLEYLWDDKSGVQTFDAMPETWPAFVESASTTLGFNANIKGFSDIVHAWQQERRDLCSKLTHRLGVDVELRHHAGIRSSDDERTQADRRDLADRYQMSAQFFFKDRKLALDVLLNLHSCRMSASIGLPVPENKGARATVTWLTKVLDEELSNDPAVCFDWPGRSDDTLKSIGDFLLEPEAVLYHHKSVPKAVNLIVSRHGVRNFKSRKKVISDLENMVFELVDYCQVKGWL